MPYSRNNQTRHRPSMVEAQIDDNLRRIFAEDTRNELPRRLRELVARLGDVEETDAARRKNRQNEEVNQ